MAIIGTLIEGKYEILKLIGKGGMSEVYLAMDKNLNKQWAVKEIKKRARDKNNEVVVQSAIAEANMMKKLDHPCLPRIVDIIDKEDVIYVVMDYIEGEPLNKVLERDGAQPQETVIEWAEELCGVLDYLHMQNPPIIYRDMKPANIMLQPNGNIKLIDFGIAREYKEHNLEDTVSLGTKGYAAPEQFGGKGQTDQRTDIYCLGVTLYHLVTGKNPCEPPYEIYPIRYWNPNLSSGLESIILKCTRINPELVYFTKEYVTAETVLANAMPEVKERMIARILDAFTQIINLGFLDIAYVDNRLDNIYVDPATEEVKIIYLPIQIPGVTKNKNTFENELKAQFEIPNLTIPKAATQNPAVIENTETPKQLTIQSLDGRFVFHITDKDFVLGKSRDKVDGEITGNPAVSRVHCKILVRNRSYYIQDLGSSNGTFLNGKKVTMTEPLEIQDGSRIRIANLEFVARG